MRANTYLQAPGVIQRQRWHDRCSAIDGKRKYHALRHCGNCAAGIRNPVFSIGCWIPGAAFSRPGTTAFLFRFNNRLMRFHRLNARLAELRG